MPLLREQECPIRVSGPSGDRTCGKEDIHEDSETEFHLPGMLAAFHRGGVINKKRHGVKPLVVRSSCLALKVG